MNLTGWRCDGCGKEVNGDDPEQLAGWLIVALRAGHPLNEDGSEPPGNSVAGDYHSAACAAKALAKVADKEAPKKKGGSK